MRKPFAGIAVLLLGSGLAWAGLPKSGWAQEAPLYGAHGVSPQAVRQGQLGSCYFHASIAALAKTAPDTLRNAIRRNPKGGYRVHFFSGADEAVYSSDVEYGRTHGYDRSEGTWVAVLMRAYAQRALRLSLVEAIQKSDMIPSFIQPMAISWLNESDTLLVAYDRAIRTVVSQDGSMDQYALKQSLATELHSEGIPTSEAQALVGFLDEKGFFATLAQTVRENGEVFGAYKSLGQGGIPVRVMEAFMGKAYAGLTNDSQQTIGQLQRFRAGGVAMVAGTKGIAPSEQIANANWWVPSHCYTLLSYDDAAQTVTLRNPWGSHPSPDGIITLPLSVYLDGYESYTYSQ
jgi:Calpain family cysteine protease